MLLQRENTLTKQMATEFLSCDIEKHIECDFYFILNSALYVFLETAFPIDTF